MPTHHEIPATPENMVLGYFEAALPPVLTIESGDTVTLHSFPAGGRESPCPDPARVPADLLAAPDACVPGDTVFTELEWRHLRVSQDQQAPE